MPWYYSENDEIRGPISSTELREKARRGSISPETLVSQDQGKWVRAAKVKGLEFPLPEEPAILEPLQVTAPQPPVSPEDKYRCRVCGKGDIQKLSVIHAAGTSMGKSTTRGTAIAPGLTLVPIFGSAHSTSEQQSNLAADLAPPEPIPSPLVLQR